MTIQQTAEKLGITTEELFSRAHKMFGLSYATYGPAEMHRLWKKGNTVPLYLTRYVKFLQTSRQLPVVVP